MELVKILKYVERSFENKPSFLLLMSDNKEYISNGCVFIENTEESRELLITRYECKKELEELLSNHFLENYDSITDISNMFNGCREVLTKIEANLPNVKKAVGTFYYEECVEVINMNLPMLEDASSMFYHCIALSNVNMVLYKVKDVYRMFEGCYGIDNIVLNGTKLQGDLSDLDFLENAVLQAGKEANVI